jgi:glycosyltransferase involved in cell wall biosynthesis
LSARAAAIAGGIAGVPKIVMVVNNMAVSYKKNFLRLPDYPVDRIIANSVDLFITGSGAAAKRLQSVLMLPDYKIKSLHNCATNRRGDEPLDHTLSRLGLSGFDGVIFGVVALLIPRKGHQVLFDAILNIKEIIRKESKGFKVLIEGDGPLLEELRAFVNSHGLREYVKFVGNERNIVNFMSILDVLVLPSIADEDFPNVILEAMAHGKPVIASAIAGIPEQVVDGGTGLLVQPSNVQQLENAILRLNRNKPLRLKMGKAAALRSQDFFSADLVVENYIRLYNNLTKD